MSHLRSQFATSKETAHVHEEIMRLESLYHTPARPVGQRLTAGD
jgi:hypothetical protein